jgi:phage terminase large subunit GpA-like protein
VIIGVNAAKDVVRQRLHVEVPGPGYMHFPVDRDIGYYSQLLAERLITKSAGGVRYRVWELSKGRANEALDCRVYAYAALCGLIHLGLKLNKTVARLRGPEPDAEEPTSAPLDDVEQQAMQPAMPLTSMPGTKSSSKPSIASRLA